MFSQWSRENEVKRDRGRAIERGKGDDRWREIPFVLFWLLLVIEIVWSFFFLHTVSNLARLDWPSLVPHIHTYTFVQVKTELVILVGCAAYSSYCPTQVPSVATTHIYYYHKLYFADFNVLHPDHHQSVRTLSFYHRNAHLIINHKPGAFTRLAHATSLQRNTSTTRNLSACARDRPKQSLCQNTYTDTHKPRRSRLVVCWVWSSWWFWNTSTFPVKWHLIWSLW